MALAPYRIFRRGRSPVVAAAIHDGHDTRPEIDGRLAIDECSRLQEEDPYTAEWTQMAKVQVIGVRSRFEIDLNRPREEAVYRTADDAWGQEIWKEAPDEHLIRESLQEYDEFYEAVGSLLTQLVEEHGRVVVYDLHSYNHRRNGPHAPPAAEVDNPEVNVGTGSMDRVFWEPLVDRFIRDLGTFDFHGRHLDVRENVKFRGRQFPQWIHEHFPGQACAIAIEVKKFFMDEWNGRADVDEIEWIYRALQSTLSGVEDELKRL
jgi:N-formylglutamate deformylase